MSELGQMEAAQSREIPPIDLQEDRMEELRWEGREETLAGLDEGEEEWR